MRFYFVRHGESEANVLHEVSSRGWKHPLTAKGRQQVADLAQALSNLSVTRLFSSPLLRAVQTAEILRQVWQTPVEVVDLLHEYDCGILEGRSDFEAAKIHHRVLQDWMQHHQHDSRFEQGESFKDIRDRFVPFIENLVQEYHATDSNIVCVAHGGLYRCVLPIILVNVDGQYAMKTSIPNAGCVIAESADNGLRCIKWCDAAF
jgi:broad specificity phosphatase PhoE